MSTTTSELRADFESARQAYEWAVRGYGLTGVAKPWTARATYNQARDAYLVATEVKS